MYKTVYKYELLKEKITVLRLPKIHKIVHCDIQDNSIMLWVECSFFGYCNYEVSRCFKVFPTGEHIAPQHNYVSTVKDGAYIWHIYEWIES